MIQELRKFKPRFIAALKEGNLEKIDKLLDEAKHLRFEIKEHGELKKLRFKLKERQEIERKLNLLM